MTDATTLMVAFAPRIGHQQHLRANQTALLGGTVSLTSIVPDKHGDEGVEQIEETNIHGLNGLSETALIY